YYPRQSPTQVILITKDNHLPRSYLLPKTIKHWYQESASRGEAQESLMAKPIGSFLIRGSQSSPGDFSISINVHDNIIDHIFADVQHFKVMADSRGQYYLWTEKFSSFNELVDYYKNNSVSKHSRIYLLDTETQVLVISSYKGFIRAQYDFNAEEKDELSFKAGDIIEVLECSDMSWWKGRLRGQTGVFPSNYTNPV
uniref:Osteoclast-stimulating factor 1 n=1 Tax=Hucho hucho TaxID=62062 RepID=A0A4W5KVJ3_9TELE